MLSGLSLPRCRNKGSVNYRVLDICVSEPVLDEADIGLPGVEQVRSNRVLQNMEVPFVWRQFRFLSVLFHQYIKSLSADRQISVGYEQSGGLAGPRFNITFQDPAFVRLQRMHARKGPLKPVNHYALLLKIEILQVKQANLAGSKSMPVSSQKNRLIAFVLNYT